jgi:hypothetical protein
MAIAALATGLLGGLLGLFNAFRFLTVARIGERLGGGAGFDRLQAGGGAIALLAVIGIIGAALAARWPRPGGALLLIAGLGLLLFFRQFAPFAGILMGIAAILALVSPASRPSPSPAAQSQSASPGTA